MDIGPKYAPSLWAAARGKPEQHKQQSQQRYRSASYREDHANADTLREKRS